MGKLKQGLSLVGNLSGTSDIIWICCSAFGDETGPYTGKCLSEYLIRQSLTYLSNET